VPAATPGGFLVSGFQLARFQMPVFWELIAAGYEVPAATPGGFLVSGFQLARFQMPVSWELI
jgi:hypothetical protein